MDIVLFILFLMIANGCASFYDYQLKLIRRRAQEDMMKRLHANIDRIQNPQKYNDDGHGADDIPIEWFMWSDL